MRRREFISLLGGSVAAWSGAARAQQGTRARRVGVLMGLAESDSDAQPRVTAFLRQLQELGWTDGGNVRIDYRWTAGDVERARAAAKDLVGLEPDVILGHTTSSVVALRQETRTIPIVFTIVSEPVANRFVESLAHPGGNLTGFTNLEPAVGAKPADPSDPWNSHAAPVSPRLKQDFCLDNRCAKCGREMERLRGELDSLRSEMIDVVGELLARVDEVLTKVEVCNRQMFADLQAQTEAGFANLQARINALPLPLSERKNDEPPKLN